ncbi:glycosyltransferase family 2 protein [Kitasatospora sp. NPDC056783]|uniref:glycosyltransferase family 2 protein n=1 Tax=Kitasatospora sp. NPDC056783 TaxID=3345943 RepID=UPI0036C8906C
MTSTAIVIPWRSGTAERNRHHQTVRDQLRGLFPDATHLDVDSGHTRFSRAASRNRGVALADQAGAEVVVLCDADTLVEEEALRAAVSAARRDDRLHLPYTWKRYLSPRGTRECLDGVPFSECHAESETEGKASAMAIRPTAWFAAGGMDERFTGWGFEDEAFRISTGVILGPAIRHKGVVVHLWHPKEKGFDSPDYLTGQLLIRRYRAARTPDQIRALLSRDF